MTKRLRIRAVQLRVQTAEGLCGADLFFDDGLVVLRADNSSGKSTVVQAIIYALGLEGMLSASQEVPLPHVMTDSIQIDNKKVAVEGSRVTVEIENIRGEIATVSRSVKGATSRKLVSVALGPLLTGASQVQPEDYYVREGGAAQNERGFHRWFADFIGWKIPRVTKVDGSECPLYVECIFPLMLVEQKRGWSAIQARMPFHYRIRDVAKKSIEFLLALDVYETALARQKLKEEAMMLRAEWSRETGRVSDLARSINGVVRNLSVEIPRLWTAEEAPVLRVSQRDEWPTLSEALRGSIHELQELDEHEIPQVQQAAQETEGLLAQSEQELADTEFATQELFRDVQLEQLQLRGLDNRLAALEEDKRKNTDVRKLKRLGSVQELNIEGGHCATCHQVVPDSLSLEAIDDEPMTIEQNVAFINSQLETFDTIRDATARSLEAKERRLDAQRDYANRLRSAIRALRRTLVSSGEQPSAAAIERRIRLAERIEEMRQVDEAVAERTDVLEKIVARWVTNQNAQSKLPKGDLSDRDERKLRQLQTIFVSSVEQFGLISVEPASLKISIDNYKPEHDGFDLDFDLSASDMIRTIWAYLYGLLELGRGGETNHLGLLVLDEPKQQETARPSFRELFRRAGTAAAHRQQVIIATSEDEQTLLPLLEGVPHQYLPIEGRIVKLLTADPELENS